MYDVAGLSRRINFNLGDTELSGKITVEQYINNCTPNPIKNVKSRYLVVNADKMIPKPNPKTATIIKSGKSNKIYLYCISTTVPEILKYAIKIKRIRN